MRVTAILLLVLFPATAFAQLPRSGEAMGNAETITETKDVTEYDFETDEVKGGIIKPLGDDLLVPQHRRTSSLVDVRANFVPEVLKSVEDI